ncbi:MAG: hypothetical protein M1838_004891 [Thelocarpon superellum]|nr:MAG: hypothetical protein M1838_004891 [Thelocarpon superellum]
MSSTVPLASGHSRWSTIKHDKGKNDAAKNRQRSALSQELMLASRCNGPDAQNNPRLATALATAKKAGFPKASIESAIARGQGITSTGEPLESLLLEAILPASGVALLVECETDSKGRTLNDLRFVLKQHGAVPSATAYMFEKKGVIILEKDARALAPDDVLEEVIDAGADDVEQDDDGNLAIQCAADRLTATASSLASALRLTVVGSHLQWECKDECKVPLESSTDREALNLLISELEDDSTVQHVYSNVAAPI